MSTRRTTRLPPKKRDPDGHPLCRWCGTSVPRGRREWCSEKCVEEYRIRSDPGHVRNLVFARDRGVCVSCGLNTVELGAWIDKLRNKAQRSPQDRGPLRARQLKFRQAQERRANGRLRLTKEDKRWFEDRERFKLVARDLRRRGFDFGPSWCSRIPTLWHADHVVPVVEGGGECGIDNYRTLCVPCHKAVTRELAARRARRREADRAPACARRVRRVRSEG